MTKNELWDLAFKISEINEIKDFSKWSKNCDWEEFILTMRFFNPQSYGFKIQNKIIQHLKGEKVPSKLDKGDMLFHNNYYEIKSSILTNTNNMLNLVQIRPWQEIQGYYCFAFDIRNKYDFKIHEFYISHSQMLDEIEMYGSSAHGTKTVTAENHYNEIAIRILCDDDDPYFKKWQDNYSIKIL